MTVFSTMFLAATLRPAGRASRAAPDAYARAVALQQSGDREGAAAAYREVLKAQPSHIAAQSTSASCWPSSGATKKRSRPIAPR